MLGLFSRKLDLSFKEKNSKVFHSSYMKAVNIWIILDKNATVVGKFGLREVSNKEVVAEIISLENSDTKHVCAVGKTKHEAFNGLILRLNKASVIDFPLLDWFSSCPNIDFRDESFLYGIKKALEKQTSYKMLYIT